MVVVDLSFGESFHLFIGCHSSNFFCVVYRPGFDCFCVACQSTGQFFKPQWEVLKIDWGLALMRSVNVCVCPCVYACQWVCAHVYVNVRMYVCMCAFVCVCVHVCLCDGSKTSCAAMCLTYIQGCQWVYLRSRKYSCQDPAYPPRGVLLLVCCYDDTLVTVAGGLKVKVQ